MSLETLQAKYPTFIEGEFQKLNLRGVVTARKEMEPRPFVWSARLSSGIFGLTDCKSGNNPHAPKGEDEVILAFGDEGLKKLIDLGFLPCPTCHPEETPGFWYKASEEIMHRYPFLDYAQRFLDRSLMRFDVRRVIWEELAPYLTALPNRLYVPDDLKEDSLQNIKKRFNRLGFSLPPVGVYLSYKPYFKEYNIK